MMRHRRDQKQEEDVAALGLEKHRKDVVFPNPEAEVIGYKVEPQWDFPMGPQRQAFSGRFWTHTRGSEMLPEMPPQAKEREVFPPSFCLLCTTVPHWPNLQRYQRSEKLSLLPYRAGQRKSMNLKVSKPRSATSRLQESFHTTLVNTLQQFWVVWGMMTEL